MANVLITGAASGLGRATSRLMAAQGWTVAAADIDAEGVAAAARDLGGAHRGFVADARDEAAVATLFRDAESALGPMTALICFAGGTTYTPDFHPRLTDLSLDDWLAHEALNSRSAFLCVREYLRARKKTPVDHGRIVLTASSAAQGGGGPTGAAYAAFKAAVLGLMKTASAEGARWGITCNAISPGAIATPALTRTNPDEKIARMKAVIPLGRIGAPDEIAAAAAFLCSPGAGYITGHTLDVNGGIRMV